MPKINIKNDVSPSTPPSGYTSIYSKTDKKLYIKDDTGSEIPLEAQSLDPQNIIYVVKNSGGLLSNYFTSVKDAVDSVTDASATNPYLINIGPGVFTEDTITLKPYVFLVGSGKKITIINVDNVNKNVIEASASSSISNLTLKGATGSGQSAIYFNPTASGDPLVVRSVEFDVNYSYMNLLVDDSYVGIIDSEDTTTTLNSAPTIAFKCVSSSGTPAGISLSGFRTQFFSSVQDVCLVNGTGATITLSDCLIVGVSGGRCCRAFDAGSLNIRGSWILTFTTGIETENTGSAPSLTVSGTIVQSVTNDLLISHPGTTGAFQGQVDNSKVSINSSSSIKLDYTDSLTPDVGSVVLGDIRQGERHDRLLNISKLLRRGSSLGVYDGGAITATTGLGISVSVGGGFVSDNVDDFTKELTWSTTGITLPDDETNYIYINNAGTPSYSTSEPDSETNIILGRVSTASGDIQFIERSSYDINHLSSRIENFQREALGPVYATGSIVTESGTRNLDITSGVFYFGNTRYTPSGGTTLTFGTHYKDGSGGYTSGSSTTVDNAKYDDSSGTLANLTASYYAKHSLYVSGDDGQENYHLVYSQTEYSNLALAQQGNIPTPPPEFIDGITLIASIIVQQGNSNIVEIRDERPVIGFKASGISATTIHGNLLGLGDDDHTQYLLANGTRSMSGSLNMGTNAITNVGTVDGVTVSAHASRHLPNGADALTTAAPSASLSATTSNATGIQNSLSRSDHSHAVLTGVVSTQTPDQTNAIGTSANLARADHVHSIPTAAATSISTSTSNTQGSASTFARADHTHAISVTNSNVASTTLITTTSTTYVVMTGMTLTPGAGTYYVTGRSVVSATSNSRTITLSIFANGVQNANSEVSAFIRTGNALFSSADTQSLYTDAIITVSAGQAIDLRWFTSAGTAQAQGCALTLIKLA